ncbi:MAG TPA: thiamine pyrophosphate-dependent enzyme, partial [Planctomycetota bacterium]|nr:thiamine pyrophosphate-dependent enzyme [Planctomycetota bacterium]
MVKSLMIVPDEVRRSETIQLGSIPVNTYRRTLENELADGRIRPEEARRIHRDMVFIREFESMLDQVKKLGSYAGIAYEHKGPAHLSIGQEGAAVGQAFALSIDDHIFGSHRSHGEILAKGLRAIETTPESELARIMESWLDGDILRVVEKEP